MENPFSRLAKVLVLERRQGFRNKAVIGGLDKFASRWEADARAAAPGAVEVAEIVALLIGYPSVEDPIARERIVDSITRRLGEVTGEAIPMPAPREVGGRPVGSPPSQPRQGGAVSQPAASDSPALVQPTGSAGAIAAASEASRSAHPAAPELNAAQLPEKERLRPAAATAGSSAIPVPALGRPGARTGEPVPGLAEGVPGNVAGGAPAHHAPASPAIAANTQGSKQDADPGHHPERMAVTPAARRPEPTASARPVGSRAPRRAPGVPSGNAEVTAGASGTSPARRTGQNTGKQDAPSVDTHGGFDPTTPDDEDYDPLDHPDDFEAEAAGFDDESLGGVMSSDSPSYENGLRLSAPRRAAARPGRAAAGLDAPVTRLPSVGPSYAEKLLKLGVSTVRDLLYLAPRRHDDYSALRTIDRLSYGEDATVIGTVWQLDSRTAGDGRRVVTATVGDGSGELQMTWFSPFVERQLKVGNAFVFSGRIDGWRGRTVMRSPEFEPLDAIPIHTARIVPIYPLTQGLSGRWLRRLMRNTVDAFAGDIEETLPASLLESASLLPLASAISQLHFPENQSRLAAARRRMSFDEFLLLQLGMLARRRNFRGASAHPLQVDSQQVRPFLEALPFDLTTAQARALDEISADLGGVRPMGRLLQGDVGSGKTAVAAASLWLAVAGGHQGAFLAPTEILAEQHLRSLQAMFAPLSHPGKGGPVRVAICTGRLRGRERDAVLSDLATGQIDIMVGTHALIEEDVVFNDLALAVVDEQHRFGVEQRATLRQKGPQPHMLVMSATPIPRSLALTVYGDLDVSLIDVLPAGRKPVKTKWLSPAQRERAYTFIRSQALQGRQAFVICPLVESSEVSEAKAAVDEFARLRQGVFPDLRLGLLHGRMKSEEKESTMRSYAAGEIDVLVATAVVEVGIDVPNATVILIEGAERFGLAQLHQFRGRVGRGGYPSYCILVSDAAEGESARRLQALEANNDGFEVAQIDLDMRGPGDFLGTRQSGLPPLRFANLADMSTLEEARAAAQAIFAGDPALESAEHEALRAELAAFWSGAGESS